MKRQRVAVDDADADDVSPPAIDAVDDAADLSNFSNLRVLPWVRKGPMLEPYRLDVYYEVVKRQEKGPLLVKLVWIGSNREELYERDLVTVEIAAPHVLGQCSFVLESPPLNPFKLFNVHDDLLSSGVVIRCSFDGKPVMRDYGFHVKGEYESEEMQEMQLNAPQRAMPAAMLRTLIPRFDSDSDNEGDDAGAAGEAECSDASSDASSDKSDEGEVTAVDSFVDALTKA